MTIHRDGWNGPITFECDGCGDLLETGLEDFHEALREAKSLNWKAVRITLEWIHVCSIECLREARKQRALL